MICNKKLEKYNYLNRFKKDKCKKNLKIIKNLENNILKKEAKSMI